MSSATSSTDCSSDDLTGIQKYCCNPAKYKDEYPTQTINYYNSLCRSRKSAQAAWNHNHNRFGKDGRKAGELALQLLSALLQPQSLAMLAAFHYVPLSAQRFRENLVKKLEDWGNARKQAKADEIAAETKGAGGSSEAVSTNSLGSAASEALEETVWQDAAIATVNLGAEAISLAFEGLMWVQLLGMVLDLWDPENYGVLLDAKTLQHISDALNQGFQGLITGITTTDRYGFPVSLASFPQEFFADGLFPQGDEEFSKNKQTAMIQYNVAALKALEVDPNPTDGSAPPPEYWQKVNQTLSMILAEDNTVVANWMHRWLPLALCLLLTLVAASIFLL
jgi:hypothetical protein